MPKGMKNMYVCEKCSEGFITVDRDEGTTPFITDCKITPGCKGHAKSSFYRIFDQSVKASWEWYKPTEDELQKIILGKTFYHAQSIRDHVKHGGLLLRKINEQETGVKAASKNSEENQREIRG